ncbi:hypothetical protein [Undibacterium sp. TC9W]|uniref:hypothetical protein n=1 Tax=Undibacterium sp. TC9W TaxID=3413053 RepID=UPI003BF58CE8
MLALLGGCAHTITIQPELRNVSLPASIEPLSRRVAFYLPDELRNVKVTTPAGGGDSASYMPYRDMELGLYKLLKNTFVSAIRLTDPPDLADLKKRDIHYLVTPTISTSSSSQNRASWAPTSFTLTLQFKLVDVSSGKVLLREVVGEGKFDQEKEAAYSPAALYGSEAARRAALAAMLKMQNSLLAAPDFR